MKRTRKKKLFSSFSLLTAWLSDLQVAARGRRTSIAIHGQQHSRFCDLSVRATIILFYTSRHSGVCRIRISDWRTVKFACLIRIVDGMKKKKCVTDFWFFAPKNNSVRTRSAGVLLCAIIHEDLNRDST